MLSKIKMNLCKKRGKLAVKLIKIIKNMVTKLLL